MIYALLFLILICIGLGLLASRQSQALDDLSDKSLDAEERAEAAAKSCCAALTRAIPSCSEPFAEHSPMTFGLDVSRP